MAAAQPNSFKARKMLKVGSRSYTYYSLKAVEKQVGDLSRLPFSLRVLMENLLRHEDGATVKKADIARMSSSVTERPSSLRNKFSRRTFSEKGSREIWARPFFSASGRLK